MDVTCPYWMWVTLSWMLVSFVSVCVRQLRLVNEWNASMLSSNFYYEHWAHWRNKSNIVIGLNQWAHTTYTEPKLSDFRTFACNPHEINNNLPNGITNQPSFSGPFFPRTKCESGEFSEFRKLDQSYPVVYLNESMICDPVGILWSSLSISKTMRFQLFVDEMLNRRIYQNFDSKTDKCLQLNTNIFQHIDGIIIMGKGFDDIESKWFFIKSHYFNETFFQNNKIGFHYAIESNSMILIALMIDYSFCKPLTFGINLQLQQNILQRNLFGFKPRYVFAFDLNQMHILWVPSAAYFSVSSS